MGNNIMEKQFDLKILDLHGGYTMIVDIESRDVVAVANHNQNKIPKFKLSDIGIDDVEQIAKDKYGIQDMSINFAYIDGYNKAKEKYKYTEEDLYKFAMLVVNNGWSANDSKDYIKQLPTKVWLEMEERNVFSNGAKIGVDQQIKVDANNYVKVLRYE